MTVGTVCYATEQGLGYLAKSFYDAGMIDLVLIFRHPHGDRPTRREWYPEGTPVLQYRPFVGPAVDAFLDAVDVVLFFETPFDWSFLGRCRERGVKTVLIPMYEWFPESKVGKRAFDQMIFPSSLDEEYFREEYPTARTIPIPVENDVLRLARVRTTATTFVHNAGNIGSRNHKGTEEVLRAIPLVKNPDARFVVRSQNGTGLLSLIRSMTVPDQDRIAEMKDEGRVRFVFDPVPRHELFAEGDVYLAPEKYNGLSLPLQEAYASGMPVIATRRKPMTDWLPNELLVESECTRKVRVAPGHLVIDECVVHPAEVAAKIDWMAGGNIERRSVEGCAWGRAHSWDMLRPFYVEALAEVLS